MKYTTLIILLAFAGFHPARAASPLPPSNLRILTQPPLPGTLVNGSFESDYIGWTFTGNQAINPRSSDGIKAVQFNPGQTTPNGVLVQGFATTPGQSYSLAFDVGADWGAPSTPQSLQVTVSGKGTLLTQTVTVFGTGSSASAYTPTNFFFVADSGTTTLTFQDVSPTGLNVDLLLDNVRVSAQTLAIAPPPVLPPTARVLTVTSVNSGNVNVTVVPVDQAGAGNGIPAFNRTYGNATTVSLSVPAASGGNTFLKWQKDGVDFSASPSTTVTMDGDHTLSAVFGTTQIAANTGAWYISRNGNDSNDGLTYATAFATPARALAQINAGSNSVVLIGPGTYNANSSLFLTRSGTPANPITICALNSNVWPPDVTFTNGFTDVVTMNEVSNCWIKNIKIAGVFNGGRNGIAGIFHNASYKSNVVERCDISSVAYGIYVEGGSSGNLSDTKGTDGFLVRSNYIHDCEIAGVYTRDGQSWGTTGWIKTTLKHQNLQVIFNTISNIPGNSTVDACGGILLNMTRNPYIYGNLILKCGANNAKPLGGGCGGIIVAFNSGGYIGWNAVGGMRWNSNHHFDGIGINPGPACDSSLWEYNYVWDCDGGGYLDYTSSGSGGTNTARYNVLVDCGLQNEAPIDIRGGPSSNDKIYNNTVVCMHRPANAAIWLETGGSGVANYCLNNTVISTNQVVLKQDYPGSPWTIRGNCYWDKSGTSTYSWNGTIYKGIAAFRSASGQETAAGLEMDPPLNDEQTIFVVSKIAQLSNITNYQPAPGSPVLTSGVDVGSVFGATVGSSGATTNSSNAATFGIGALFGDNVNPLLSVTH